MRLAVRDELPSEIDASDIAENMHGYLFMTELTWPSLFFGTWAAWEPDVIDIFNDFLARNSLSLGKRCHISNV